MQDQADSDGSQRGESLPRYASEEEDDHPLRKDPSLEVDEEVDEEDEQAQPRPPRTDRYYRSPESSPEPLSTPPRRLHRREADHDTADPVTPVRSSHKRQLSNSAPTGTTPKAVKLNGYDESLVAKMREYDPQTQAIIKTTMDLIEVKMLRENPFPSPTELAEWISEQWVEACKIELEDWPKQKLRITDSITKMVSRSSPYSPRRYVR